MLSLMCPASPVLKPIWGVTHLGPPVLRELGSLQFSKFMLSNSCPNVEREPQALEVYLPPAQSEKVPGPGSAWALGADWGYSHR